MDFQGWLSEKYRDWRGDKLGQEGSISAYAAWIGVSNQAVREWMYNGVKPKHKKLIDPLVACYGLEVYEVLEMEPPNDLSQMISFKVSPRQRRAVEEGIAAGLAQNMAEGVTDEDQALVNVLMQIIKHLNRVAR